MRIVPKIVSSGIYEAIRWWLDLRGLGSVRARLMSEASGDVLEVGAGTGANLRFVGPGVSSLTLVEPDPAMAAMLRRRAARRPGTRVVDAKAESLPLEAASVDTVVVTLVLCSVEDPGVALREFRRVLRPGGRLLFAEHVRSPVPGEAARQDRLSGPWRAICGGCHPNRDTRAAIEQAGFTLEAFARTTMRGAPRLVRPMIVGSASVPDR